MVDYRQFYVLSRTLALYALWAVAAFGAFPATDSNATFPSGADVQARSDAAFSGSGWTPATAGTGADADAVWGKAGFVGPISMSMNVSTVRLTFDKYFTGDFTCLIGAGTDADYASALMGSTPPSVFTNSAAAGDGVTLDLTGLASGTYVGYCSSEVGGRGIFLSEFSF